MIKWFKKCRQSLTLNFGAIRRFFRSLFLGTPHRICDEIPVSSLESVSDTGKKGKLYLGQCPLMRGGRLDISRDKEIHGVVSCLEDHEFRTSTYCGLARTAGKGDFSQLKHHHIVIPDHQTTIAGGDDGLKAFFEVVKNIHEMLSKGENVYLHCNEGKGRSFMVALFYLCIYDQFESIQEAADHIRAYRPQVSRSSRRLEAVEGYLQKSKSIAFDFSHSETGLAREEVDTRIAVLTHGAP